MEILHRYCIKLPSDHDREAFTEIGIELERGAKLPWGGTFIGLDIGEFDKRWATAQPIIERYKVTEFLFTKFSDAEWNAAKTFCLLSKSHWGYPQPEDDFAYLSETYDLREYCSKCGIGARQVRPFRIRKVPLLKRNAMQLNWVFDEFFVSYEVWAEVFKPFGVECWPVVLHSTGSEIGSVVQLRIEHMVDLTIEQESACSTCGRPKTQLDFKGFAPAPFEMLASICRSTQYFGSGSAAFNRIMISTSLYMQIKKAKLRGLQFYPCEPHE